MRRFVGWYYVESTQCGLLAARKLESYCAGVRRLGQEEPSGWMALVGDALFLLPMKQLELLTNFRGSVDS